MVEKLQKCPLSKGWYWTREADAWLKEAADKGLYVREAAAALGVSQNVASRRYRYVYKTTYEKARKPRNFESEPIEQVTVKPLWPTGINFEDMPSEILAREVQPVRRKKFPPIGPITSVKGAQRGAAI